MGGQTTTAEGINFHKLAISVGYKNYYKISDYKNIKTVLKKFINTNGPVLLEVKIRNESLKNLSRPKNLLQIKKYFMGK